MRRTFAIVFGVLLVLSLVVWVIGGLTAAIVPWFGGLRADRIGQIGAAVFICGEGLIYITGWLFNRFSQQSRPSEPGLPGPKSYGNKKLIAKPSK